MVETAELERPRRGRPPRAQEVTTNRRRRKAGTLDRMAQFKLDFIDPEALDLENYVYYWINDEGGALRRATKQDDYDHVTTSELAERGGFDAFDTDSESDERVRMIVGQNGSNPVYAYLCKKPRAFWIEDNEAMVRAREDMMAGRVYHAEGIGATFDDSLSGPPREDEGNFFSTPDSVIGHAGRRRSGPIPRSLK